MRRTELDAKLVALALQGVRVLAEPVGRKQHRVRIVAGGVDKFDHWIHGSEFKALSAAVAWWEQQEARRAHKRARRT